MQLNPESIKLRFILEEAKKGKVLIPEFQREFIWSAEDIKELLASILGGYFIGTLLIHENTKRRLEFEVKPLPALEKNDEIDDDAIVKVILDGQQRINSILYAIFAPNKPLKANKNPHRFFIDLKELSKGNFFYAVKAVTASSSNKDYKKYKQYEVFENTKNPIYVSFEKLQTGEDIIDEIFDILKESSLYSKEEAQKVRKALRNFLEYEIFYIKIPQDTNLETIVEIFERINKTSYKLSTIDLVLAKLYKESNKVLNRKKIEDLVKNLGLEKFQELIKIETFFKALSLLLDKQPTPANLINITTDNVKQNKDVLQKGIKEAFQFLQEYNIEPKLIPYKSMLIPLISMFSYLEKIKNKNIKKITLKNYAKLFITHWFWLNIFTERYDEGSSSKSYQDYRTFKDFINTLLSELNSKKSKEYFSKLEEEYIYKIFNIKQLNLKEKFLKERLTKNSALLKGFFILLLYNKVKDFDGTIIHFSEASDEHIFPKRFFASEKEADILLNRTLLKPSTNSLKHARKPSEFFKKLESSIGEDMLKNILATHFINEHAFNAILKNNYNDFLNARYNEVLSFIKEKQIIPKTLL